MVSETDSELTSRAPYKEVFTPHAEGSLPEKGRECPAVSEYYDRQICLKGRRVMRSVIREEVAVWFLVGVRIVYRVLSGERERTLLLQRNAPEVESIKEQ